MDASQVFQLVNLIAMVGWLLLIIAPKWIGTQKIVFSGGIVAALGVTYAAYLLTNLDGFDMNSFSTLDGVVALFKSPESVLVGWVHYLAFDLMVGMWEAKNAQRHGIPHWALIPCLLLTFMFGPLGLVTYFLVRLAFKKGQLAANF